MSRLDEIKARLTENAYAYGGEALASEDVEYLLNEVKRYRSALKELSRYTHPDYPFKELISELHTLINLSLKES